MLLFTTGENMKIYIKLIMFLASFLYVSQAMAEQDNIITWYKPEFPPLSIVNGPDAGKGYSDRIEAFLMQEMTHYQHQVLVSPFKRTVRDMKKGLNVCSVTLLKTPARTKFITFSKPVRLLLPNGLVLRKEDLAKLAPYKDNQGAVSVEKVIQSGALRIGYSNGRSYTKAIDKLLTKYKDSPILIERLGNEGPKGLLTMLSKGHIDAMFAQPVEALFHGKAIGIADDVAIFPISEIKDYTVGYIGCSKTPWGEAVIQEIDKLIKTAVRRKDFRSFYEEFLDAQSKVRYRKIYDDYFKIK